MADDPDCGFWLVCCSVKLCTLARLLTTLHKKGHRYVPLQNYTFVHLGTRKQTSHVTYKHTFSYLTTMTNIFILHNPVERGGTTHKRTHISSFTITQTYRLSFTQSNKNKHTFSTQPHEQKYLLTQPHEQAHFLSYTATLIGIFSL